MTTLKYGRGYTYSIEYHIVWCIKYRELSSLCGVEDLLHEIIQKIADDNNFEIVESKIAEDSVYLLISCSPQQSIPSMIKALKGVSARLLLQSNPELGMNGSLWKPSYFVATMSNNLEQQISEYIQKEFKNSGLKGI